MNSLRIQIPSLPENIRIVESFIDNVKDKFQIDDDIYGNIMVAVTESVNNAIVHGNKGDRTKNVVLAAECQDNHLKFIIEDEGPGFNYDSLPDPTAPENLDKIGGRGIFLMKHLSDLVEFKNEGRTVELSFYFN
ncbi:MAG: ATP-binding protein [Sporocytophaga sp.]|uniref:Anti-sigma regulatory factor n=1 Tax=Sporocytophaga myxococcoides TaxID=153721 RepID=A0A098LBY2_9BACT|nr:ATP-binding protein [Sporocytophaga myxococcoides]MCR6641971.1 ATP-binding protein [Sporocytophaga sp.]GAL84436.1 anti-sigma regulatory factor [Sporocytophaga myxococcoides]